MKVKRLPPPYDSNCFDYKNSKSFKSRGHCINDCLIQKILKDYNCIPRRSANILTLYDNITLNSNLCLDNNFEDLNENGCSDQCSKPCEELFVLPLHTQNYFNFHEHKHYIYRNNVYMTFIYFMTSIGGLLGLWNNISVYDLQLMIIKICAKIFKFKLIKNLSEYLFASKILKSIDLFKSFVTKINLKVRNKLT
jgi:hypothetical protein